MDPNALAGMVFTLLLAGLVGGFILLAPLSKRLGLLLEQKANDKNQRQIAEEVSRLNRRIQLLEDEVRQIADRQQFTDELLVQMDRRALNANS